MTSKRAQLHAALRLDFATFVKHVFEKYYRMPLDDNWHIDKICFELEKIAHGKKQRQIINAPPRSLKSFIISVCYPLWRLGNDPTIQIVCVSYSDGLVEDLGKQRQAIAKSVYYRSIFPNLKLDPNNQSSTTVGTIGRGKVVGISLRGSLTGVGGDVLILDDPMKADDALNARAREATFNTFRGTLFTRLNHRETGSIILTMQRLHDDDLTAQARSLFDDNVLEIPAIATRNQKIRLKDGIYHRRKGEPLHANRANLKRLAKDRRALGTTIFEAQYQQNPLPLKGNRIELNWFGRRARRMERDEFSWVALSVDPASTLDTKNDYSAIAIVGFIGEKYEIIHMDVKRRNVPELERQIVRLQREFKANYILIEQDGVGRAVYQGLRERGVLGLRPIKIPRKNKQQRFAQIEGVLERGDVMLPMDAPWLAHCERELLAFPYGKHDDQVDSIVQAIHWGQERRRKEERSRRRRSTKLYSPKPEVQPDFGGRARAYERSRAENQDAMSIGFTRRVLAERHNFFDRALG